MNQRATIVLLFIFTSFSAVFAQTIEEVNKKKKLSSPSEILPVNSLQGRYSFGQYILPGEALPFSAYNSLFPHTGVGASVSVDLKKDTEMSVGAEYQYDNKSQQWKLESSGRVSIGF